jgi:hypothetical protein
MIYTPQSHSIQAPDNRQVQQFLQAIDPDPDALFGFRTFDDRGDDPRLAVKAYGTLTRGVRQCKNPAKDGKPCHPGHLLSFMQGKGAGAFAAINKLDGQGQLKANVVAVRALYVDADSRPEVDRLHAFIAATGLAPTALVASGGVHDGVEKLQGYWRVDGCPVAEFTAAQLTLVSRISTDPAVQDAGRVMRVPGYWHQKREPRQTRIVSIDPAVHYEYREFMARVTAQPQIVDPWANGKGTGRTAARVAGRGSAPMVTTGPTARLRTLLDLHGSLITPAVRALLREAVAPSDGGSGNRHDTLKSIAARCVQAGWSDDDIRQLVLPVINGEWGDGDWTDHFGQIIAWTRTQEVAALAAMPAVPKHIAAAFGVSARAGGVA